MNVIMGSFKLHDEQGLSLADQIIMARGRGVCIDLLQFVSDARLHGWSDSTILRVLRESLTDAGVVYSDVG